jgi:hypothetical protein
MANAMPLAVYSESEEEIMDQEQGMTSALPSARPTQWARRTGVAAAIGLGVLGLVGVFSQNHGGTAPGHMNVKHLGSRVNLNGLGSFNIYGSRALQTGASGVPGVPPGQTGASGVAYGAGAMASPTQGVNATSAIIPVENMHDGNTCGDDEELLAGLCYRQCSLLAPGYPKRTSAWTCCREPCSMSLGDWRHDFGVCSGFSVAGTNGQSCPHKPGACLANEEMLLGECFKSCSILTNGEYPNRVAAATCCKVEGVMCFNPMEDDTSPSYAVGGGAGDGDPNTPSSAHAPMTSLTEAR